MRPTQEQVRARASSSALLDMASAIRREGGSGERRRILEDYKPVHVHRGGADDDLAVASSRSDLDRMHRCGARAARVLGLDDADYLVNAVPSGPRLDWWGVHHMALGASILALHPRGSGDELGRVLDSFELVPATVVAVHAHEAVELAALRADHRVEATRVHTVLTVGPPPDEATRDEIRDAFSTLADGFSQVAAELEGVVLDFTDPEAMDPETMAKLESLDTAFGAEYEAAAAEVDAWMTENCADIADTFDLDAFGS